MAEEDEITLREPKPREKAGPLWSREIIFEPGEKYIRVEIWAPSEKYPEYSYTLRLVERRKIEGEWERKTIILSNDGNTFFLTEAIEEAWLKLREMYEEG